MLSDEQLVQAMARGDQAAFEALVNRYHGPLLGFLERKLNSPEKAEDVVQETFVRLIRQLKQDALPEHVRPWLYRVALNQCRDYWRSSGYKAERHRVEEPAEQLDHRPSVVEIYERQETRKEILQSLGELPELQRDIVFLRFYQDLKLQEIAETVNAPLSTIKTNLYKALRKLKDRLAPDNAQGHSAKKQAKSKMQDGRAKERGGSHYA